MKTAIFLFVSLLVVEFAFSQSGFLSVEALGKRHGEILNRVQRPLVVEVGRRSYLSTREQPVKFKKSEIRDLDYIRFFYPREEYIKQQLLLAENYLEYHEELQNKKKEVQRDVNAALKLTNTILEALGLLIDFDIIKDKEVENAVGVAEIVYEVHSMLDPGGKGLVNLLTTEQRERVDNAYLNFDRHEKFYEQYKTPTVVGKPITAQLKDHPYYKSVNPNFIVEFLPMSGKSKLDQNWSRRGGLIPFSAGALIAISPEIHFSRSVKTKLYMQVTYDRFTTSLSKDNKYFVNNVYNITLDDGELFQLARTDSLDLVIKQLSVGLNLGTVYKKTRFEIGAGYSVDRTAFLHFHEDINYGFKLEKEKFKSDITQRGELFDNPYALFGFSFNVYDGRGLRGWLERPRVFFKAVAVYQRTDIASENGMGIFNENNEDLSRLFRPENDILTVKAGMGVAF